MLEPDDDGGVEASGERACLLEPAAHRRLERRGAHLAKLCGEIADLSRGALVESFVGRHDGPDNDTDRRSLGRAGDEQEDQRECEPERSGAFATRSSHCIQIISSSREPGNTVTGSGAEPYCQKKIGSCAVESRASHPSERSTCFSGPRAGLFTFWDRIGSGELFLDVIAAVALAFGGARQWLGAWSATTLLLERFRGARAISRRRPRAFSPSHGESVHDDVSKEMGRGAWRWPC